MNRIVCLATFITLAVCFLSSEALAQEWCQDGDVLWCVDECETQCQQDESTEGFFMCEATARFHMADNCSCDSGFQAYKVCMKKFRKHFVEAARHLEKLQLIEAGTAYQIRQYVKQKLADCKAQNP